MDKLIEEISKHKIHVDETGTEMVPFSVVQDCIKNFNTKFIIEESFKALEDSIQTYLDVLNKIKEDYPNEY